jgi:tetratricopeptide (TPR) repeat protein
MISLTLLMLIGLDQRAGAEDFTESWYLSRGRANMEIENYKAAIEAYEKVVERDPNHREAIAVSASPMKGKGSRTKPSRHSTATSPSTTTTRRLPSTRRKPWSGRAMPTAKKTC